MRDFTAEFMQRGLKNYRLAAVPAYNTISLELPVKKSDGTVMLLLNKDLYAELCSRAYAYGMENKLDADGFILGGISVLPTIVPRSEEITGLRIITTAEFPQRPDINQPIYNFSCPVAYIKLEPHHQETV